MKEEFVKLRRKLKISQVEAALFIGITATALSRFENGRTDLRLKHAEKYAECLGMSLRLVVK